MSAHESFVPELAVYVERLCNSAMLLRFIQREDARGQRQQVARLNKQLGDPSGATSSGDVSLVRPGSANEQTAPQQSGPWVARFIPIADIRRSAVAP